MPRYLVPIIVSAAVALLGARSPAAQNADVPDAWALAAREQSDWVRCGTGEARARQLGLRPLAAVSDGRGISFVQDPPILTADYDGPVVLRDFIVAGDVPEARFVLSSPGDTPDVETWARTETRQVGGRLVSVFNPSWSRLALADALRSNRWGWDDGGIYWGEFLPGDTEPGSGWGINLRIAPQSLPRVTVTRLADDVQYSSHAVNIVIPGFGDGFLRDDQGFELPQVAQRFFQEFEDTYDTLAVVPDAAYLASYSAFHRNTRNDVRGIGLSVFDNDASYGSPTHRLSGMELYTGDSFTRTSTSSHELAHQWGSYIDWARLTGVRRAGASPESHDPLWAQGETLIGAALRAGRRVEPAVDGWQIGLTPLPARLHPFTLYAMGLLSKEEVPPVEVFDDQGQFSPTLSVTPAVGVPVTGASRSATVFNVIGMLGERSGPVPAEWNRATVVVSRDRLLTPREMDYWTYFAARSEDPAQTGVISYDGVGSFDAATSQRVDLKTAVRPLHAPAIEEPFDVDARPFDRSDVRGVTFDSPVPSRYTVGHPVEWSGVVKASDRSDINLIMIRFWKYGGDASTAIRVTGAVNSRSSFRFGTQFTDGQRGVYEMEVYLFWPDSGAQYSRTALSPIVIE